MRISSDKMTTWLGVAIALNMALSAQGAYDASIAGLIGAILLAISGYYTNK